MKETKITDTPHLVIKKKVRERLDSKETTKGILTGVLNALAEPIIKERQDLVLKGLEEIDKTVKELKKFVPDQIDFPSDDNGVPNGTSHPPRYSKEHKQKRDIVATKLDELYKAFDEALVNLPPDYNRLKKLIGKPK